MVADPWYIVEARLNFYYVTRVAGDPWYIVEAQLGFYYVNTPRHAGLSTKELQNDMRTQNRSRMATATLVT